MLIARRSSTCDLDDSFAPAISADSARVRSLEEAIEAAAGAMIVEESEVPLACSMASAMRWLLNASYRFSILPNETLERFFSRSWPLVSANVG